MSEVMELLRAKLGIARRVLADLVQHYQQLNDDQRLEKSNIVLDQINSYMQIEQNLLFPLMARTGDYRHVMERTRDIHGRIDAIIEKATMMHVDEPSFEYYDDMARLLGLLDALADNDNRGIFPWAAAHLTDEDSYHLITHLKDETAHESLPAFR
jgi:hypothetical protein